MEIGEDTCILTIWFILFKGKVIITDGYFGVFDSIRK